MWRGEKKDVREKTLQKKCCVVFDIRQYLWRTKPRGTAFELNSVVVMEVINQKETPLLYRIPTNKKTATTAATEKKTMMTHRQHNQQNHPFPPTNSLSPTLPTNNSPILPPYTDNRITTHPNSIINNTKLQQTNNNNKNLRKDLSTLLLPQAHHQQYIASPANVFTPLWLIQQTPHQTLTHRTTQHPTTRTTAKQNCPLRFVIGQQQHNPHRHHIPVEYVQHN